MSNQLEKLKNSIKKEYVNNFELNLMESSGFIPVDKRQNDFFVILNKDKSANKNVITSLIKEKFQNLNPQFIPIAANDFSAIFSSVTNVSSANGTNDEQVKATTAEPSAEEILVSIGWLTK